MHSKSHRPQIYYREHLSINDTQRSTSLLRNTIKKWLKAPRSSAVKYQRAKQKVSEYIEVFHNWQKKQERLGCLSPVEFIQQYYANPLAT
ncbi:MAG: IS3 family transposase [Nitrosomonas sp.]